MATLAIKPIGGDSWEMELSKKQSKQVKGFLKTSGERNYQIIHAALITVRTNSSENFTNDFFLPTLINHASHVEGTA